MAIALQLEAARCRANRSLASVSHWTSNWTMPQPQPTDEASNFNTIRQSEGNWWFNEFSMKGLFRQSVRFVSIFGQLRTMRIETAISEVSEGVLTLPLDSATWSVITNATFFQLHVLQTKLHNKLIRRWDSERELYLRRHRTRTTKYNRLVHKFRQCRFQVMADYWSNFR